MKNRRFSFSAIFALFLSMSMLSGCGRKVSRIFGEGARQVITVSDMRQFISLSYDYRDGSNVKDITYLATDGNIYTREYKDASLLDGAIRWVPYGQGSSLWQSRSITRVFGGAVNLELPKECQKVLGVDITYAGKGERTKNLTFLTADGKILSKEYREGAMDRNFEGWLEVRKGK
ncbi:MAG: hypothetical protein HGA31_06820 [Candidatus Moranbacteria bacterium]|nr:hypothetical protein [Candidatus Moranbacteria bacterium]